MKLSSSFIHAPVRWLRLMCWLTWSDPSSLPVYAPSIRWNPREPQDKGKQLPNWRIHSYAQQLQCGPQEAVGNKQYCLCVTWLPRKYKQAIYIQSTDICVIGASPTSGSEVWQSHGPSFQHPPLSQVQPVSYPRGTCGASCTWDSPSSA